MPKTSTSTPEERFWRQVDKEGPYWNNSHCWIWMGNTTNGYGFFRVRRKTHHFTAHRFAYQSLVGFIPEGLQLDHLCRNRRCVNPEHLEPVLPRVNVLRGIGTSAMHAKQTQCIHGHPFNDANTYITPDGRRQCRICCNDRRAKYYASRRKHL